MKITIIEQQIIKRDKLLYKQHELTTKLNSFNNTIDTFQQFSLSTLSHDSGLLLKKEITFIFYHISMINKPGHLSYLNATKIITTD